MYTPTPITTPETNHTDTTCRVLIVRARRAMPSLKKGKNHMSNTDITIAIIPRKLSDGSTAYDLELEQDGAAITMSLFTNTAEERALASQQIADVIEENTCACVTLITT